MPRRKRRIRSPHPGVVVLRAKPEFRQGARARWRDPDTKRVRVETIPNGSPAEQREWLIDKSRKLARRHDELREGASRMEGASLSVAVEDYFKSLRVRDTTVNSYKHSIAHFTEWAGLLGIHSVDDLTSQRLALFRDWLGKRPKKQSVEGGKRGERREAGTRSPVSLNHDLRAIRTMLEALRVRGKAPRLSSDHIRDALKRFKESRDQPEFLRPAHCKALLAACIAHDAATFDLTRDGQRDLPRFEPIAPFTALLLLTGMRRGEALGLAWSNVDLEAQEIRLTADQSKTARGRTIDLSITPAAVGLLSALRPRKAEPDARVFKGLTASGAKAARERLCAKPFNAPAFDWQTLRSTCATFLTNAPSIFGGASAYHSARQLGHSVQVAEAHYLGRVKIPAAAKTLEAAMGVDIVPIVFAALMRSIGGEIAVAERDARELVRKALASRPQRRR